MKKRRVAGTIAGIMGVAVISVSTIIPVAASEQTTEGGYEIEKNDLIADSREEGYFPAKDDEKVIGSHRIQISDSSGNHIIGAKVEITVEPKGAEPIKKSVISDDHYDPDMDPELYNDGGEGILSYIEVGRYQKETKYTLHFVEVPAGYEKPGDIVFIRREDGEAVREELLSSGGAVVEINRWTFDKINLLKTGEAIANARWMKMQTAIGDYNGRRYFVGADGNQYTGWHYMTEKEGISPSAWMYFDNYDGGYYTGWKCMDGEEGQKTPHWSYFGEDGKLRTGWQQMGQGTSNPDGNHPRHWSYFGENGWLRTGWKEMGKGTSNPDGNHPKHMSYFGDNGWLREGWQQMGRGTSNPDGNNPWHMSYFGENGWLRTGWKEMGKGTSNPDGNHPKHWSYFGENGWLRTGWKEMGQGTSNPDGNHPKHWSYFGPNGWLRTYWQDMGKGTSNPDGNHPRHRSYFGDNGWLRTGKQNIDGKVYVFTDTGWLKK